MAWSTVAQEAASDSSGFPWIWVLIGILVVLAILVLARSMQRRRTQTPGGTTATVQTGGGSAAASDESDDDQASHAEKVLAAFGGFDNITSVDACITRLRISVKNKGQVDKAKLKSLGAAGVLEVGDNMQAIFGTRAEILKGEILDLPGAP